MLRSSKKPNLKLSNRVRRKKISTYKAYLMMIKLTVPTPISFRTKGSNS